MFDLEQSITDWRRQMLDAGIKTPVPLEELEIHLREDITRQIQYGTKEQLAFENAIRQIGQSGALRMEFAKSKGLLGWVGESRLDRINQILGALWAAQSAWFLVKLLPVFLEVLPFPQSWLSPGFAYLVFGMMTCMAGILGGMLLFRGTKFGRSIIRIIAAVGVIECIAQIVTFKSLTELGGILVTFCLISIWLLRSQRKLKSAD